MEIFQSTIFLIHEKILIDSIEREYILFKPKQIKANAILSGLHGRGGTGEELMYGKQSLTVLAEEEGFIMVLPVRNQSNLDRRKKNFRRRSKCK